MNNMIDCIAEAEKLLSRPLAISLVDFTVATTNKQILGPTETIRPFDFSGFYVKNIAAYGGPVYYDFFSTAYTHFMVDPQWSILFGICKNDSLPYVVFSGNHVTHDDIQGILETECL